MPKGVFRIAKKSTQLAKISKRIQETRDTVTLRLQLPDPFEWEPGQFIMVLAVIEGNSVRRAYSVSSLPNLEALEITIRQTDDPTMSKYLNEVQEGEELEIRGPYGKFVWTEEVCDKAFFLGAGSGITPFRAFFQYMESKNLQNEVTLLYSCANGDNVIFKDELGEQANRLSSVNYELSLTREKSNDYNDIRKGRIDQDYLREKIQGYENANFYMCGTPGFVKAMMGNLEALGIDKAQLKREQWG